MSSTVRNARRDFKQDRTTLGLAPSQAAAGLLLAGYASPTRSLLAIVSAEQDIAAAGDNVPFCPPGVNTNSHQDCGRAHAYNIVLFLGVVKALPATWWRCAASVLVSTPNNARMHTLEA